MKPSQLVLELSKSFDARLAQQLIDETVAIEEAFALKKWKYTELDGGRFAEVAARILYSVDSANLNLTKSVDDCLKYIDNEQVPHSYPERQGSIHLAKVIRSIYKLRSQRGAVHVSPTYTANELDSRLILESVRWTLAEILRTFVTKDLEKLADTIRTLARFPQPLIRLYGETALLQSTTFTTEEEVLAHLLFADKGLTLQELIAIIPKDQSGVRRATSKLLGAGCRQIVSRDSKLLITDLGVVRIEEKIASST